jgi:hypothetical protein
VVPVTPEPEESNVEQIIDANFDLTTGRYKENDESIVSCAMLDRPIVFVIEDENNGL